MKQSYLTLKRSNLRATNDTKSPHFPSTSCYTFSSKNIILKSNQHSSSRKTHRNLKLDRFTHSSVFSSSLWSTVNTDTTPSGVSRMQRESPTEATVTVHLSTITKVAVVPDVSPDQKSTKRLVFKQELYLLINVFVCNVIPLLWNCLSVLTKPATKALGKA